MTTEPTFLEHANYLSRYLRERYDLTIRSLPDGDVELKNEVLRMRIFPGWPKDPYVHVTLYFSDPTIVGRHASFELWRYIRYRSAWASFPTTWHWDGQRQQRSRDKAYSFVGSPFLLLEAFVFLGTQCQPLFEPDRSHLRAFADWMDEEQRRYNERVSRK